MSKKNEGGSTANRHVEKRKNAREELEVERIQRPSAFNCLDNFRCSNVKGDSLQKLAYLSDMTTHPLNDLAGMCLETGIEEAWKMYRRNPKYKSEWDDMDRVDGKDET